MDVHAVVNYEFFIFEPKEAQEIPVGGVNVKGVKHLLDVARDGGVLCPESN